MPARGSERTGHPAIRGAVLRFAAWSLCALVAVAIGASLLAAKLARDEALRDAERIGTAVATGTVAPRVDALVRAEDAVALAELDEAVRNRKADGSIVRVKVWNAQGRIIYSDDARLIGMDFPLRDDARSLLAAGGTGAGVSRLDRDENRFERSDGGRLLEVYAGVTAADGEPLLVETYLSAAPLQRSADVLTAALVPLAVGSLLVLQVMLLPLAVSLARRVDRGQAERRRLLQHAVNASDLERRRVAQDLHDGVLQDLAGVTYALTSLSTRLERTPGSDPATTAVLSRATSVLGRDVRSLRGLLTDIYPPDLLEHGLVPAVTAAVEDVRRQGPDVSLAATPDLERDVAPETVALAFRVVRESLRNVVKHAAATRVEVRLDRPDPSTLRVRVTDDGVGFDPERVAGAREGHLGMRVLADTLRDVGGSFDVASVRGGGTTVVSVLAVTP